MFDLIIIGSGPAGLTAAIYARRANLSVLIIEKNVPGGQMVNTNQIDNYPGASHISGVDLALSMYNQVTELEVEFAFDKVIEIKNSFEVVCENETYQGKRVLVATGREPKRLGAKGEEELLGKGISFCAICDGTFYRNKDVIVVGGGNSAIEEALYLSQICHHVYVLVRNQMRADEFAIEELNKKENVEIRLKTSILEFINEDGFKGVITNQGTLEASGCFLYVGNIPKTDFLSNLEITDSEGYVIVDSSLETKVKGLYSAGDVIQKTLRQVVTATNDGAIAATNIIKSLGR